MNQMYSGVGQSALISQTGHQNNQTAANSLQSSIKQSNGSRGRKKSSNKQQQKPIVVINQSKTPVPNSNNGGLKIKREDLKIIQQYCEQNDLPMGVNTAASVQMGIEIPSNIQSKMVPTHYKNKSEGATPLGHTALNLMLGNQSSNFNQMASKQLQFQQQLQSQQQHYNVIQHQLMNSQQPNYILQNPVLDYQKFLEDEKLYLNQKAKSQLGYYSQNHQTPHNNSGRLTSQHNQHHQGASKSPDLAKQLKGSGHPQNQAYNQNVSSDTFTNQQKGWISQSALSNYSNQQNLNHAHHHHKESVQQPSVNQPNSSRPNQSSNSNSMNRKQTANQNLNYNASLNLYPSMNFNSSNPQSIQSLLMQNNPSQHSTYHKKAQTSLFQKANEEYSLEAISKDQLNESSHFLYDDSLVKSTQHINNHFANQTQVKNKSLIQQNGVVDESYFDATLYEQFISGPHNIGQYQSQNAKPGMAGQANNDPLLQALNDAQYQYHSNQLPPYQTRPLSQNAHQNMPKSANQGTTTAQGTSKFIRHKSPQVHYHQPSKPTTNRANSSAGFVVSTSNQVANNASMNTTQQNLHYRKSQRTANNHTMQHSLNSSGGGGTIKNSQERRLMMGRTPSPNFLKRIAGLMNINQNSNIMSGSDFVAHHQLYKNSNIPSKNIVVGGGGVSSKRSTSKQNFTSNQSVAPNHQNQNFSIGLNGISNIERNIKQKITSSNQHSHHQRYKSGSVTTSANTPAQGSPKNSSIQIQQRANNSIQQRGQSVSKRASGHSQKQAVPYNDPLLISLQDSINKRSTVSNIIGSLTGGNNGSNGANPQQKLKMVNEMEEKKALALVQGFNTKHLGPSNQILSSQQQNQQQNFYQPVKMIGEIMEEDPEPLSSHEFIKEDKSIENDQVNLRTKKGKSGGKKSGNSQRISKSGTHTPATRIIDGGTGSNGITNHLMMMSKGSSDNYSMNPHQYHQINIPSQQSYHIPQSVQHDQTQLQVYLDQLRKSGTHISNQSKMTNPMIEMRPNSQNKHQRPINPINQVSNMDSKEFLGSQKGQASFKSSHQRAKSSGGMISQDQYANGQRQPQVMYKFNHSGEDSIGQEGSTPTAQHVNPQHKKTSGLILQQDQQSLKENQKKKSLATNLVLSSGIGTQNDVPKITAPNMDMYKYLEYDEKLKEHTNFQKKQQQIQFQQKNDSSSEQTPFEKELEQKTDELKQKKNSSMKLSTTQDQYQAQKYKEDSISILKQLQNTGVEVVSSGAVILQKQKKSMQIDAQNYRQNQQVPQKMLVVETGDSGDLRGKQGDKDQRNLDLDDDSEPVMITQEDEKMIKEVVSDINEKAFYGKLLKKTSDLSHITDQDLLQLSARSREIAIVQRIIRTSFNQKNIPPITTTDFYRIGKMLGRGAFGKVNLAMHKLVRKLVAIKSLNKECLTDEAQKQKLMKEVSLLLKLRHNHVVKIYETIETEKHIIIVMELCAGGDLLNYVRKRRRLKEPYAKVIFKQIIDGLCYIHSKYIAHRDIKLDNILLDGKGNVKIGDFGVSKQCVKGQKMSEQCGTPAYIAPEILKDKGYTFSVDLWSAGVVLFAMLYGTVPFKANNMEELHKLIVKGKYVLKDDISIEARNLLRGLLEVNPEKRLTIKQIYRHKWFADLDPNLQLFNDQEREMIRKEYTYNDPRRYNRNENEEPVDCFTEHNLESVYNSLKNASSKSIILAPFNSTQSEMGAEEMCQSIQKLICEKMMVLKFARRCREIDRQYEFNNNGELDNGVYHKFVNNDENNDDNQDGSGDERNQEEQKELLNVPMLMSTKKSVSKPMRGGRASVENSFEEDSNMKRLIEKQHMAQKIKEGSAIQKEIHRNQQKKASGLDDLDKELVQTYEEYQKEYSNKLDVDKIQKLVQLGYPIDYVKKTLEDNEPNYCTAGYYLMGMDQNYC